MTIRFAREGDLASLAALERLCFSEPWSEGALREQLSSPLSVALVCEDGDALLGYAYGSVIPPEGELYRIAVKHGARRGGIGKRLLAAFLDALRERGAVSAYLEVRESNLAARSLYESAGFSLVGIRKNYYHAPPENAAVMQKERL